MFNFNRHQMLLWNPWASWCHRFPDARPSITKLIKCRTLLHSSEKCTFCTLQSTAWTTAFKTLLWCHVYSSLLEWIGLIDTNSVCWRLPFQITSMTAISLIIIQVFRLAYARKISSMAASPCVSTSCCFYCNILAILEECEYGNKGVTIHKFIFDVQFHVFTQKKCPLQTIFFFSIMTILTKQTNKKINTPTPKKKKTLSRNHSILFKVAVISLYPVKLFIHSKRDPACRSLIL